MSKKLEYLQVAVQFYKEISLDTILKIIDILEYDFVERIGSHQSGEIQLVVIIICDNPEELAFSLLIKLRSIRAIKLFEIESKEMPESFLDNMKSLGIKS